MKTMITIPAFARRYQAVTHGFGTRTASAEGFIEAPRVSVKQVHGTEILDVDQPVTSHQHVEVGHDALVTNQPGIWLTVRTADCVPVLLYDPRRHAAAAIHAGWRGAVAGIVPKVLAYMEQHYGTDVADVEVAIGPSVGPCCYEVDEVVLSCLRKGFAEWPSVILPKDQGKAQLDLKAFLVKQVAGLGVPVSQTHRVRACTACYPDLFYSYRRDGHAKVTMVSGIRLDPPRPVRTRTGTRREA
jgi:YfiH family protein